MILSAGTGKSSFISEVYNQRIPKSAKTPDEMLTMCGLNAEDICQRAMSVLQVV